MIDYMYGLSIKIDLAKWGILIDYGYARDSLTHWFLRDVGVIFKGQFLNLFYILLSWKLSCEIDLIRMPTEE